MSLFSSRAGACVPSIWAIGRPFILSWPIGRERSDVRYFQAKSIKKCSFCVSLALSSLELNQHAMRRLRPRENMHELRSDSLFLDWVKWDGRSDPKHGRYHAKRRCSSLNIKEKMSWNQHLSLSLCFLTADATWPVASHVGRLDFCTTRQMLSYVAFVRCLEITMGEFTKMSFLC